jgi:uncharacterized protein (DUF1697 family)
MMTKYIALLRGINVGGNNIIKMADLKAAFERQGFQNVVTYINSGNVLFDLALDEAAVKIACENLIAENFGLDVPVCVIPTADLIDALSHAPDWWNINPESKHNAIFVIPPMTTEEVCAQVGEIKPEYEKLAYHGKVLFWSAPIVTFSRTRLTKIVQSKAAYNAITIRNANTTLKLAELTGEVPE